jgi:hypothetical protein
MKRHAYLERAHARAEHAECIGSSLRLIVHHARFAARHATTLLDKPLARRLEGFARRAEAELQKLKEEA